MNTTILAVALFLSGPKVELSVGAGGDSNPFELPDDQAAGAESRPAPGMFVPVEASAQWKTPPKRVFRAGIDAWVDGRFFAFVAQDDAAPRKTNAQDANRWTGEISVPLSVEPFRRTKRAFGVRFAAEPFVGMHRETYTSHRTGAPLVFDDRPGETADVNIDLSDRYDTNEFGVAADADLGAGRMADLVIGGRYTRVDYLEDYDATEHLDSWDYDEVRGELDAYLTPGNFRFAAGYSLKIRTYDERFPRDGMGEKVEDDMPGYEPQVFTYHDVSLRGGYIRAQGRAFVRFRNTRRIDGFEGYQSYTENSVSGVVRLAPRPGNELAFDVGYSVRTYDELRVSYDPQEPVSDRKRLTLDAGYEWPALSRRTYWFLSAGVVSQSSANPLYSYAGFHGMTGVRVEWR